MKKQVLLLVSMFILAVSVSAQQLTVPMNFVVNSPASVAGTYDYGEQVDWGPTFITTTCGDMKWGYTAAGDSLACDPIVTDLTGTIALISRGACNFSLKVYHAQVAGAIGAVIVNLNTNPPGEIVGMLGGDSMNAVVIPAVFLPYQSGGPIGNEVAAGNTVNACFFVPQLDEAQGLYHYSTPVTQIRALDAFNMRIYNNGTTDETNVMGFVEITDPNGTPTTISESAGTITAGTDMVLEFTNSYMPSVVGTYTMRFTATSDQGTYTGEEIVQEFEITDYTFGNDNKETPFAVTPADYPLRLDIGNAYYPTANGIATHASFGLSNVTEFHGEPMEVYLYETEGFQSDNYDDYNAIALTNITIDSTIHSNGDTIVVELLPLFTQANDLIADSSYLVTVQYDAIAGQGLSDPPGFLHTSGSNYQFIAGTVYTDALFLAGWAGGQTPLLRLHLDGYVTSSKEVQILDELAVSVYPNPATQFITLDLDFEEMAENVNVKLIDLQGRLIRDFNYNNIQNQQIQYDIDFMAPGNYFIRVETENGFATKHFIVIE